MHKNIKLLAIFNFFSNINFIAPIVLVFFQQKTGSYALATGVISIVLVSAAFFEIPTGILSDSIGRKRTFMAGSISMLVALIFFGFAGKYMFLVIGAIFNGLSKSFYSGNNEAFLYNTLQGDELEEKYHHFAGKLESVSGIAAIITALLAGFIAGISFPLLIWLSLIPQTIGLMTVFMFKDVGTRQSNNVYQHLKEAILEFKSNSNLRLLSIAEVLGTGLGPTAFEFQSAVYKTFWPTWLIGIARALQETVALVPIYFSGVIIDKIGKTKVMLINSIYSWLMNIIAVLAHSALSPLFIALSPLFWGPSNFASGSLLQKEFTEKQRATMASLNSLVGSLLFAFFLFIMGLIADRIGPVYTLGIILILQVPGLILHWKLFKIIR